MRTSIILCLLTFAITSTASAQISVLTNGGSGLSTFYPSLQSAIVALNGTTITSPVVFTCNGGAETAPSGGYVITAQGSATNTITIQGSSSSSSTITAPTPAGTAGSLSDGFLKLVGADYVTLKGFVLNENASNNTTAVATNNLMEWGVAILYASTTNGAQNNTISNNTISMRRTYTNTFGVYSNSTHSSTTPGTNATATSTAGANNGLKIYGNNISNVNNGIYVVGATDAANFNNGVDIGGSTPAQGNIISNFATAPAASFFANSPSSSISGIMVKNSVAINISNNNITPTATAITSGTLRGIYLPNFTAFPTATTTTNILSNTLSMTQGSDGISIDFQTGSATSATNINGNIFSGNTTLSSFIYDQMAALNTNINDNKFSNVTATGSPYLIKPWFYIPAGGSLNVNNNTTVGNFVASGSFQFMLRNFTALGTSSETYSNNNISNVTATGGTGIVLDYATTPSTITVNGNTFSNWTAPSPSNGNYSPLKIARLGQGNPSISNNTVSNISNNTVVAIELGNVDNIATSVAVKNNVIDNLAAVGAVTGILCSNTSNNIDIAGNVIRALSSSFISASATLGVTGISVSAATNTRIHNNRIGDFSSQLVKPMVSGILISAGADYKVFNNIVGDLRAPNGSNGTTDCIRGLNITSITAGSTIDVAFNTIYLNANGINTLSTSGIYHTYSAGSTDAKLILRNNLVLNNSLTNGTNAAFKRSAGNDLSNYSLLSKNNSFYAESGNYIYSDGSNSDATLAAYKARMYPREQSSISDNTNFVSTDASNTSYLHIAVNSQSQLESAGTVIPEIATDYDLETRLSPPDIGADEFYGYPSDVTGPSIDVTPLKHTTLLSARTLFAKIYDPGSVPQSGAGLPVLYWKINAGSYSAATAVSVADSLYSFTFGSGVNTGDSVSYYIVAQDVNSNVSVNPLLGASGFTANPPAVSTPPAKAYVYKVVTGLSGNINVGTNAAISSVTNAGGLFDVLNNQVLTGNLTVHITSNLTAENANIQLAPLAEEGAGGYILTIKPDSIYKIGATVAGSFKGLLQFNGADRIIINGSANGTTSRDLTISAGTAGIFLSSSGSGNGCTKVVIKNTVIAAGTYGIYAGGNLLSATGSGEDNDSLQIYNNDITGYTSGIYIAGTANGINDSITIRNNVIRSFSTMGISLGGCDKVAVSGNELSGSAFSSSANVYGINASSLITNTVIEKNNIHDLVTTASQTGVVAGINYSGSSAAAGLIISNNMISSLKASASTSAYGINGITGIRLYSINPASGIKIYFNSVNLGNGAFTGNASSLGLYVGAMNSGLDIQNNVFYNNLQSSGGGKNYAFYSDAPKTAFNTINYNDYFVSGALGTIAYMGADISTLAALKAATGQDANSLNVQPVFLSVSDAHMAGANAALDKKGTPIAGFTSDIDGDPRNPTLPTMGADEAGYYEFIGNGNWNIPGNWVNNIVGPTIVPGNTEVLVNPSGQCTQTGDLATQPGGKITVNPGKTLNLNGSLSNAGSMVGAGILNLANGASQLSSTGTLTTTMVLTSKKMVLNGDLSAGAIMLTNKSKIELGNFNLKMDTFALTGNDSNFIVTNGTGNIYRKVGTTPVLFPVGADSTSYTPVTITSTAAPGGYKVKATSTVTAASRTTAGVITNGAVNRSWTIIDSSGGGRKLNAKFQWMLADEMPGFNRNNCAVAQSHACQPPPNCTDIYYDVAARGAATGTGNGPFTITRDSISAPTSFIIKSSPDTSTFTGNGSWTDPNNWTPGIVPPTTIGNGREIIINHAAGGQCTVVGDVTIQPGGKLNLPANKKLVVTGKIIVQ